LFFLVKDTSESGITVTIRENESPELESLSKKLKIDLDKIEITKEENSNKDSNSLPSLLSSFEILVKFFENILNDKSHLYETSASDRQLFKYKLRKMEALYSVTDEERLRIKEMFSEKLPDLVLFVLLESPNYLLNERFLSCKEFQVEKTKQSSKEDTHVNKNSLINEQLVPQSKQNFKMRYHILPLTHRQNIIFEEMIRDKEFNSKKRCLAYKQSLRCSFRRRLPHLLNIH
jgi:hypothetical protein